MSKIDLHIHTSYSDDGEFLPLEIVAQCKNLGMELIAVTDHNSVRGVPQALTAAQGLRIVSGVELDCTCFNRNFHLLGYCFDSSRREFTEIEQDIFQQEQAAAGEKIRLFEKATGISIQESELTAPNGIVTGEMIAEQVLTRQSVEKFPQLRPYLPGGEKSDMPNVRFYWDFFSEGKPAYVPIRYLSLSDAVRLIHSAGGIAVLAHPGQNLASNRDLLPSIISQGIDGIETFSSYHSKEDAEYYLEAAEKHRLLVTCGSDFHGRHKPNIQLGGHGALWRDEVLLANFPT